MLETSSINIIYSKAQPSSHSIVLLAQFQHERRDMQVHISRSYPSHKIGSGAISALRHQRPGKGGTVSGRLTLCPSLPLRYLQTRGWRRGSVPLTNQSDLAGGQDLPSSLQMCGLAASQACTNTIYLFNPPFFLSLRCPVSLSQGFCLQ